MAERQKDQADNNEKKSQGALLPVPEKIADAHNQQAHADDGTQETEKQKNSQRMYRVALGSVIVNAVLAIATFLLYQQATIQSDAAIKAAGAAQKYLAVAETSIAVARRTAEISEQSSHADLRAYFSVTINPPHLKVGDSVRIGIEYKNVGKTPAYDFGTVGSARLGTGVYPDDIKRTESILKRTSRTVSPGQPFFILLEWRRLTENDSIAIASNTYKLNVWGKFIYTDKFGGERFIHFCCRYDPSVRGFVLYDHYNDAN